MTMRVLLLLLVVVIVCKLVVFPDHPERDGQECAPPAYARILYSNNTKYTLYTYAAAVVQEQGRRRRRRVQVSPWRSSVS